MTSCSGLLALGITRAEVAERLGVSVRDVKKAPTGNARADSPTEAAASEDDAPASNEAETSHEHEHSEEPAYA